MTFSASHPYQHSLLNLHIKRATRFEMSKPPLFSKSSIAGIVQDPNSQQRIIPESRRSDGSIRKERKVKPGFVPAEDMTRFRPSRQLEAERNKLPPGSVVGLIRTNPQIEAAKIGMCSSKSAKKNAKRKENRANAAAASTNEQDIPDDWDQDIETVPLPPSSSCVDDSKEQEKLDQDSTKRAKQLSKIIKAAESLKQRAEKGEKLLPEQQTKVDAVETMRKELESLGLTR